MIKNQIAFMFFCFLTPCLFGLSYTFGQSSVNPPNIVLILVDDAALQDFGVYGGEAFTPHIDELARGGLLFTNYRSSLMCAPARAMLMTGCDSHLAGVPNLPVFLTKEQTAHPNYDGILNSRVETVASQLKANGYKTYITGKWHLGNTSHTLPSKRGFDRTFILGASGGDNYDIKGYLPFKGNAPWFEDGKALEKLPDDFYSSSFLVDKMIEFMNESDKDEKPFFSYLAFQAIHIPVQAPKEFVKKYKTVYRDGWGKLKHKRFTKAKELGLISSDAVFGEMLPELRKWKNISEEEQIIAANDMAVNAAMLEAMDYNIGRYITHLKSKGLYDNTVFIITSDNGPEGSVVEGRLTDAWMNRVGYHRDQTRLGEPGYYGFIGPEFASAAAGPLAFFKFNAGEGGLRVPLIISGDNIPKGEKRIAFSYVTDIAPTILDIAGISERPSIVPMTGKSLMTVIQDQSAIAYQPDEPIGIEAAGHRALYKGDMKLTRNAAPLGDHQWRLYNVANDPGETKDLSKASPIVFAEMIGDYSDYSSKMGVLEMGSNYVAQLELENKVRAIVFDAAKPWLWGTFGLIFLGVFSRIMLKRTRRTEAFSV